MCKPVWKLGIISVILLVILVRNGSSAVIKPKQQDIAASLQTEDDYDDDYDYQDEPQASEEATQSDITTKVTSTATTATTSSTGSSLSIDSNLIDLDDSPKMQKCPLECDCSSEISFVNCSGRDLTSFPKDLPPNLIKLDLSNNSLTELDLNWLLPFSQLRELNVQGNQIHLIKKLVTETSAERVMLINLAENQLSPTIDADAFGGLPELRKLVLDGNEISAPESGPFLNLPQLEELSMRNCSLEGLSKDFFANLTGLLGVDMANNPFTEVIDVNAFQHLTELGKLRVGAIDQDDIPDLCDMLTSIDVINFPDFNVSCFQLVSGSSFEESIITNLPNVIQLEEISAAPAPSTEHPETHKPNIEIESQETKKPEESKQKEDDKEVEKEVQELPPITTNHSEPLVISDSNEAKENPAETTDIPVSNRNSASVSQDTMNKILLGILAMAVMGLIIGIICRRDCCGIKTKLCRTRRPQPTDQVSPAPEEVPLNKITTNGNTTNGNNCNC